MEQQKDTQKTPINLGPVRTKEQPPTHQGINLVLVIHKKTERVVAALFLVTDYLSDNNPIRHKIRLLGVELLSFIVTNNSARVGGENHVFFHSYASRLLEIISLLEVAHLSEQISEMNFTILGNEIERLVSAAERMKKQLESSAQPSKISNVFTKGQSGKGTESRMSVSARLRHRVFYKGHSDDKRFSWKRNQRSPVSVGNVSGNEAHGQDPNKSKRKDVILNTLAGGKHLTIKDISSVLYGTGEKTIQRELSSLVHTGVLKREGERRWSKYYLA